MTKHPSCYKSVDNFNLPKLSLFFLTSSWRLCTCEYDTCTCTCTCCLRDSFSETSFFTLVHTVLMISWASRNLFFCSYNFSLKHYISSWADCNFCRVSFNSVSTELTNAFALKKSFPISLCELRIPWMILTLRLALKLLHQVTAPGSSSFEMGTLRSVLSISCRENSPSSVLVTAT